MFRDVYMENNYVVEDMGIEGGLDIWITQCTHYNGPMAIKNVKTIVFNKCDNRFQINIKSASDQIDCNVGDWKYINIIKIASRFFHRLIAILSRFLIKGRHFEKNNLKSYSTSFAFSITIENLN